MATLKTMLHEYGQLQLLENLTRLPQPLLDDLADIDWEKVGKELKLIKAPTTRFSSLQPIDARRESAIPHPASLLKGRILGCIVMAGGQATRLNGSLPKGLIPVSPITHKPTLQMIAEKVLGCSKAYNTTFYLGIMTSDASHEKIEQFFASHNYFGLPENTFSLFRQESLPALDEAGQLIIKDGKLFKVPDGNGSVFRAFSSSLSCKVWEKAGVEFVSIINSDNPLIDPFLPNMFEPLLHGTEMTAAAVERSSENELVGLFVQKDNKEFVAEYSELDPALYSAKDSSNNLLFKWANISFFACTLEACMKAAKNNLPLHMAKKFLNGTSFLKAEYFVFDHCPLMSSFRIVPIERDFFAPIKTLQGPSSPEAVGRILLDRDKKRYSKIFKKTAPADLELPEEAYYTNPE